MKFVLPIFFASIAAIGNALFAFGQRQSETSQNGLLFIGACAMVACLLAVVTAPFVGPVQLKDLQQNAFFIGLSGLGLFLTYLGFNLLYSKFGAAQYVLYATISIITTTVIVGFVLLKEPLNGYHFAAIACALATVVLFSIGQAKA